MNAIDLVDQLETLGVVLWEEEGELRFRAPRNVMTAERRATISDNRKAVIDHLRQRVDAKMIQPDQDKRLTPFPLTDVQSAYLLGRQEVFAYGGVGCQIYVELSLPAIDLDRLENAWNRLIRRHDMLRVTFHNEGYQQVAADAPTYAIAMSDLRASKTKLFEKAVAERREQMINRQFAADQWPLFDLAVTQGPEHSLIHFSIDCLVADFMSVQLLLSELAAFYREPDKDTHPLTLSFRDYVLSERADRDSGQYQRDQEYWTQRLDNLPSAPTLPQLPGAESKPPEFRRLSATIGEKDWADIKSRSAEHGVTPTVAVLNAYSSVIGRWSRSKAFSLNLTLLNRRPLHAEVGDLVGDFTTVTLLGVDLGTKSAFADRAKVIQEQLWRDLDHRLFSGVEVMREIARRSGQGAALMPVVFTSTIGLKESGTELGEPVYGLTKTPQVWIDCQVVERGESLVILWDIREGVLPEAVVDDMFGSMEMLLHDLANDAAAWNEIKPLPLPEAQQEARIAANNTSAPLRDRLLHLDFIEQASQSPGRPAIIDSHAKISYGELAAVAGGIAQALKERDCKPSELVAVALGKGWRQIAAVLGTMMAGVAYLPLDTSQPALRRDRILKDAGVRLVLADSNQSWPDEVSVLDPANLPSGRLPETSSHVGADALAYVIYTSGSTGTPKGVMISHRAALNTIDDINRILSIRQGDRVFGLANLSFDLSVYDIFGPLSVGGSLVLPDGDRRDDPTHWRDMINDHGVTVWNSVPAQMQMLRHVLATETGPHLPDLRSAMLSGDWIPLPLAEWIRTNLPHVELYSLGGATEASIWSIIHLIGPPLPDWPSVPYGKPLSNQTFHALDQDLQTCPDWVTGDLFIGGSGLAIGYHEDQAKTKERFIHHPQTGERLYWTGDLGRYRPGGLIEFLGREDTQIKIRGYRIELSEVEAALVAHPAVISAAAVVSGSGDTMDSYIGAFVQVNPSERDIASVDIETLIQWVDEHVPSYMVPRRLEFVEVLPLTENGKIDRNAIQDWISQNTIKSSGEIDESFDQLESNLADIWMEILGLESVGKYDDFFQIGGDSLLVSQMTTSLQARIPEAGRLPFPQIMRQMLHQRTIVELAKFLREATPLDDAELAEAPPPSPVTPLGDLEEGPAHVLIHDLNGTMAPYLHLSNELKKSVPLSGLAVTKVPVYLERDPATLINNLVDQYAALLQPQQPEQLVGYGMGGLLAAAVASRLREAGQSSPGLTVIGSCGRPCKVLDDLVLEYAYCRFMNVDPVAVGYPADNMSFQKAIKDAAREDVVPDGLISGLANDPGLAEPLQLLLSLSVEDRLIAIADQVTADLEGVDAVVYTQTFLSLFRHSLAGYSYFKPAPYAGDILLLLPDDPEPALPWLAEDVAGFWQEHCLGELQVRNVPGNHFNCLSPPHVTSLSKILLGHST